MVAENRRVKRLLDELLDGVAGGAALHMRKALWLACEGEAVSFAALQARPPRARRSRRASRARPGSPARASL